MTLICEPSPICDAGEQVSDAALLHRYVAHQSEEAFAQITRRHAGWVYHVCRRNLRDAHQAEDATQAVFLLLSRKAPSLKHEIHLAGWLFQTCRYVLADLRKHRTRYRKRFETVCEMARHRLPPRGDEALAPEMATALDDAMAGLRETDRQAILMRFYEDLDVHQMARILGVSEESAKKRLTRALARLRKQLLAHSHSAAKPAVSIAGLTLLLHQAAASAAPVGLAATVAEAATVPGLASVLAEMIATGVRQAAIHGTTKLLAALVATTAPVAVLVTVAQPPSVDVPPNRPASAAMVATERTSQSGIVGFSNPSLRTALPPSRPVPVSSVFGQEPRRMQAAASPARAPVFAPAGPAPVSSARAAVALAPPGQLIAPPVRSQSWSQPAWLPITPPALASDHDSSRSSPTSARTAKGSSSTVADAKPQESADPSPKDELADGSKGGAGGHPRRHTLSLHPDLDPLPDEDDLVDLMAWWSALKQHGIDNEEWTALLAELSRQGLLDDPRLAAWGFDAHWQPAPYPYLATGYASLASPAASVPEPAGVLVGLLACSGLLIRRRRIANPQHRP